MKKISDWLKKWSFFALLGIMGIIFFFGKENREACLKPFQETIKWCQEQTYHLFANLSKDILSSMNEKEDQENKIVEETAEQTEIQKAESEFALGEPLEKPIEEPIKEPAEEITYRPPEQIVWKSVEDNYFEDAVFIGDSRTVGLFEYAGLEETATFYASTGLTVYKMFTAEIVETGEENQKKTVEQALTENTFSKIYLMLGINEMGTGTVESFMKVYQEAVNHLRELQPDAIIYLQAIMKVTTERSNKGDYITNEGIDARNAEIAKLANNVNIFYLDVNPFLCDETGGMDTSYTFDGVHLKARYVSIWKDFLKTYAIEE